MKIDNQWIGPFDSAVSVGTLGFLISCYDEKHHRNYLDLSPAPARTNISQEPKVRGICGATNGIDRTACGVVRVLRLAKNGRAIVAPVEGEDLIEALAILGYPELTPESSAQHIECADLVNRIKRIVGEDCTDIQAASALNNLMRAGRVGYDIEVGLSLAASRDELIELCGVTARESEMVT